MTANTFAIGKGGGEPLLGRVLGGIVIFGLHVVLVAWIAHVQFDNIHSEPPPIRLDVRTIEVPPPAVPEMPKPVVEQPKPLPQTAKPVIHRKPQPTPPSSVLTAPPSTDAAPAPFTVPSQPATPSKSADPPPAPPAPATVSAARFDADYLQNPKPAYPALSHKLREEGKVLLLVQVTAAGTAEHVQIKQSSGYPRLDEAALNTVRNWRFVPARRGDEAIASSIVVPLTFRLDS